jgi:quercetin dioxygenase-like cupin family protein
MTPIAKWAAGLGVAALVLASALTYGAVSSIPTELLVTPLTGDSSRVVRLINVQIPVGADSGRHHHPGDQYTTVQEGEIQITVDGQSPQTYKAGQVVHIPPMIVHRTQNVSDKPARTLEVFIVAKDQPNNYKDQ